ncbi:MAG TPA: hypothetical protein VK705_11475 [Ferruginibacter sp.]|jgi:hypothetical protein|nr:hypothetical protein [Ferruginibacter sp.]
MPTKAVRLNVKEKESDLMLKLKYPNPDVRFFEEKIKMLMYSQKKEKGNGFVSKIKLAEHLYVNHNTIQKWRTLYIDGGIEKLLGIRKDKIISKEVRRAIYRKLYGAKKVKFKQLHAWAKENYLPDIKYDTFYKYIQREFQDQLFKFKRNQSKNFQEDKMRNLFKTSYYYYSTYIKKILSKGGMRSFRFIKNKDSSYGIIAVEENKLNEAKRILNNYKKIHHNKEMWWELSN